MRSVRKRILLLALVPLLSLFGLYVFTTGLVAFEMAVLVKRVGPHLLVDPRPGSAGSAGD